MKNGRDHQATPLGVRSYASARFGPFDTDAAASDWNVMAGVTRYFSAERSFLSPEVDYDLGTVWMNPPWANIDPFVDQILRLYGERRIDQAVLLLPTRTGRPWYARLMKRAAQLAITSESGRICFDPPPGEPKGKGGFEDCAFFLIGYEDAGFLPGHVYFGPRCAKGDLIP